jgi:DNA-binding beta-propeller fold protein YncE
MIRLRPLLLVLLLGLSAAPAVTAAPAGRVGGDYVYAGSFDVGAPGAWDYASFYGGRLYLGHRDTVAVMDAATREPAGSVGPLSSAHGAVADLAIGRGFATSGGDGVLEEFDLATFAIVKQIPVGKDDDGITFDPATGAVLLTVGDGKQLVIVDARTASVTHTVDLPGEPEFLAADGKGKVFVNIASTGQMSRIDIASGKLEATWDLTGCARPHGLGYDHRTGRLFAGCANGVVAVVDPAGKLITTLPAGPQNDAILIDEKRGRVFCPNGDGTLTVIAEGAHDNDSVLRTIPTFLGARSGAIDPATGTIYLTYGQIQIVNGYRDPGGIRFGWSAARIAVFTPND